MAHAELLAQGPKAATVCCMCSTDRGFELLRYRGTADGLAGLGARRFGLGPLRTRSTIISRSKALNTDNMPYIMRPAGVLVSKPC